MNSAISPEAAIVIASVSGLFAILGSFAGSYLSRSGELEKWQRETRSATFSKYLELLFEAREKATTAQYDNSLEDLPKNIKVTEAYLAVEDYVRIVCLYLPNQKRSQLKSLTREIAALHGTRELGDSRLRLMDSKLDEIQEMFEGCL